jgi:hypothetical protein
VVRIAATISVQNFDLFVAYELVCAGFAIISDTSITRYSSGNVNQSKAIIYGDNPGSLEHGATLSSIES